MFDLRTGSAPDCSAVSRRTFLRVGGLAAFGLTLPTYLRAVAETPGMNTGARKAKRCILLWMQGGPSHLDTFDPKPDAPAEVRGEFGTIATSAPGVRVTEHLPRLARVMHRAALVRSVTHAAALHDSASIHALTGRPLDGPDRELFAPQPQAFPSYGSAVARLRSGPRAEVACTALPFAFRNVHDVPCQGGGFLGAAFDPLRTEGDPQ